MARPDMEKAKQRQVTIAEVRGPFECVSTLERSCVLIHSKILQLLQHCNVLYSFASKYGAVFTPALPPASNMSFS